MCGRDMNVPKEEYAYLRCVCLPNCSTAKTEYHVLLIENKYKYCMYVQTQETTVFAVEQQFYRESYRRSFLSALFTEFHFYKQYFLSGGTEY